jgi:hypothetical protein
MIYSRKYGKSFEDRAALQRYAWRDYRTRPILSWFGLRDCVYSDEYRKQHGLPVRGGRQQRLGVLWIFAGFVWLVLLLAMCSR